MKNLHPKLDKTLVNIVKLIERYLLNLLALRLNNWMSAPAAGKTTPIRATLVHPQIDRIGITKDESYGTSCVVESEIHAAVMAGLRWIDGYYGDLVSCLGAEATGIKDGEPDYTKYGVADIDEQDGRADCGCDQTTDDDDMRTVTVGQAAGPTGHEQPQDTGEAIEPICVGFRL